VQRIARNLRASSYQHTLRVNEREGEYHFDCSLMTSWILQRAAPRALARVGSDRPVARDFYRAIARASREPGRGPWQRVPRILDARPGDILAWVRPPWFRSNNTGHVAVVVAPPRAYPGGVLVRIADASSYNHEDDTRSGLTGFGIGVILVTTDPVSGEGTGYGWVGRYSGGWTVPTPVVIGRVSE